MNHQQIECINWEQMETKGCKPSARIIKSVGFDPVKERIYVFGGGLHNNKPVDDPSTYCLDLSKTYYIYLQNPCFGSVWLPILRYILLLVWAILLPLLMAHYIYLVVCGMMLL
jgi:hypothetical protein